MQFTWDKKKAAKNLTKHKVSFEEATSVFDDVFAAIFSDEDNSTEDEERQIIVGASNKGNVLFVVFWEQTEDGTVRIISARKADHETELEYWRNRA